MVPKVGQASEAFQVVQVAKEKKVTMVQGVLEVFLGSGGLPVTSEIVDLKAYLAILEKTDSRDLLDPEDLEESMV